MRYYNCIIMVFFFLLIGGQNLLIAQQSSEHNSIDQYPKGKLLYQDNFNDGLKNWVVETPDSPYSKVGIEKGTLVIDVDHGATVWFNKKLSGNMLIEYHRKVSINNGHNDRLSDLNQFLDGS